MAYWYLIHGAASSRLIWSRQMKLLNTVERAELPDFFDRDPSQLIDAWADWCLERLNQPAVVMGHSLGGAIAQVMALKAPTLVQGLVLVGTGPHLPVNATLLDRLKTAPAEALAQITRWSLARDADPGLLAKSLAQVADVDGHSAYRQFLACTNFDVRDRLDDIRCPRIIIQGAEDRMTPAALTGEFLTAWPDALHYTVPHAGHSMMVENPDAFNHILGDIIDHFNW